MARYTRVYTQFWTDEKVIRLSEDARTLLLYLLTCPHGNMLGIFVLPDLYACADLKWAPERYDKALTELRQHELVVKDDALQVIWLQNYLKHNPIENPSQAAAAVKVVEELPRTPLLRHVVDRVRQCGKDYLSKLIQALEARCPAQCSAPCQPPSATPVTVTVSVPVTEVRTPPSPTPGGAGEDVGDDGHKPDEGPSASAAKEPKDAYTSDFEEFWRIYPRKVEKRRAFKSWRARLREGVKAADMILAARQYSEAKRGTEQQYLKHPATFLSRDRPFADWIEPTEALQAQAEEDNAGRGVPVVTDPDAYLAEVERRRAELEALMKGGP